MTTPSASRRALALVTGASAGIGAELAARAAADGFDLVLSARRVEPLEALAGRLGRQHGATSTVIAADLSTARGPATLVKDIEGRGLAVDVLVNNAGFGAVSPFAEMGAKAIDGMIAVNIAAVTRLARALLPGMLERRRGGILNGASTAAFQPGPLMAVYYASKAYVLSFSEALWEESKPGGGLMMSRRNAPRRWCPTLSPLVRMMKLW